MKKRTLKLIALILTLATFVCLTSINAAAYIYYPTEYDNSIWETHGLYVNDIINNLNNLGDANMDNTISIADARMILCAIAELTELDEKQEFAADVNQDGKISIADAKQVLRYIAGLDSLRIKVELEAGQEYTTDPVFSVGGLIWSCNISPENGLDMDRYIYQLPAEKEPTLGTAYPETFTFTAKTPGTYEVNLKLEQPNQVYLSITYIFTVK